MRIVTVIDAAIVIILAGAAILGFFKGFAAMAAQLAALLASYAISAVCARFFSSRLFGGGAAESMAYAVLFAFIFAAVFFLLRYFANIFKLVDRIPFIGKLDRVGGAVAGFLVDFAAIYIITGLIFGVMPQEALDSFGLSKGAVDDSLILSVFYRTRGRL